MRQRPSPRALSCFLTASFLCNINLPSILLPSCPMLASPPPEAAFSRGPATVSHHEGRCSRRTGLALLPLLLRTLPRPVAAAEQESWGLPLQLDGLVYIRELGKGGFKTVYEVCSREGRGAGSLAVGAEKLTGKQRVRDAITTLEVARYVSQHATPEEVQHASSPPDPISLGPWIF